MGHTSFDKIKRVRKKKISPYRDRAEMIHAELASPRITDSILAFLLSATSRQLERRVLYDLIAARYPVSVQSYNTTLGRLSKRKKLFVHNNKVTLLDISGAQSLLEFEYIQRKADNSKKVIVIFDIPEAKSPLRKWIRSQLHMWDFVMLQQSVWVGYGPIPPAFKKRMKKWKVDSGIKYFNVSSSKL